jgi:hypothetical protein
MNWKLRFFRLVPNFLVLLATTSQVMAQGPTGVEPQPLSIGGSSVTSPYPTAADPAMTAALAGQPSIGSSPTTASATRQWINGTMEEHYYYRSCFPEGSETLTSEYTGYWGTLDASYPKVGDVYYGHVVVGVVGSSCAGGADVAIKVQLPDNTAFFSSGGKVAVKCYYGNIGGTLSDVTADPSAGCTQTPTDAGLGWWDMSGRIVPNGKLFEMMFPIYSTQPLAGMAGTGTKLIAEVTESIATTFKTAPYQWVTVGANPVTISYPSPSYTILNATDAKTFGNLNAHYATGNVYFDIGETTAYEYGSTAPFYVNGTSDTWSVWASWTGFTVGHNYFWRIRFVSTGGATYTGAIQSFVFTGVPTAQTYSLTTSASPSNGGTVSLAPPGGSYAPGTPVNVTATANAGFKFSEWTLDGTPGGTANPLSITMNKYRTVVANFMPTGNATINYHLYLPLLIR